MNSVSSTRSRESVIGDFLSKNVDLLRHRNIIVFLHIWGVVLLCLGLYIYFRDEYYLVPIVGVLGGAGVLTQMRNTGKLEQFLGLKQGKMIYNPFKSLYKRWAKPEEKPKQRKLSLLQMFTQEVFGGGGSSDFTPPATPEHVV
jgi:hypothetical protein